MAAPVEERAEAVEERAVVIAAAVEERAEAAEEVIWLHRVPKVVLTSQEVDLRVTLKDTSAICMVVDRARSDCLCVVTTSMNHPSSPVK